MGYRIEYGDTPVRWKTERLRWGRIALYGGICFLLFCVLTVTYWPAGAEMLADWIYPGDAEVTRQAFHQMALQLRAGESVKDAVMVFCREILDGAQIPG